MVCRPSLVRETWSSGWGRFRIETPRRNGWHGQRPCTSMCVQRLETRERGGGFGERWAGWRIGELETRPRGSDARSDRTFPRASLAAGTAGLKSGANPIAAPSQRSVAETDPTASRPARHPNPPWTGIDTWNIRGPWGAVKKVIGTSLALARDGRWLVREPEDRRRSAGALVRSEAPLAGSWETARVGGAWRPFSARGGLGLMSGRWLSRFWHPALNRTEPLMSFNLPLS